MLRIAQGFVCLMNPVTFQVFQQVYAGQGRPRAMMTICQHNYQVTVHHPNNTLTGSAVGRMCA